MDRIICVVGPTASGKTKLAVQLAKAYDGEVVSCDSMQIYKHMDIGTAKPTPEEMEGVPHHMIDCVEPGEDFSVGKYVQLADGCVQDILSRGKTAVIAGGTGLYVDSLIAGRTFADEKRIIRALEVYAETGRTITQHNLDTQQIPPRYRPVWIGLDYLDRAVLYRRIDLRVNLMLQAGLLDEIRALLARGVSPRTTAMQAIGYKEFFDALEGRSTLSAAADLCKQRSRNYAKRQLTWFRRNPQLCWLRMTGQEDFAQILAAARQNIPFSAL